MSGDPEAPLSDTGRAGQSRQNVPAASPPALPSDKERRERSAAAEVRRSRASVRGHDPRLALARHLARPEVRNRASLPLRRRLPRCRRRLLQHVSAAHGESGARGAGEAGATRRRRRPSSGRRAESTRHAMKPVALFSALSLAVIALAAWVMTMFFRSPDACPRRLDQRGSRVRGPGHRVRDREAVGEDQRHGGVGRRRDPSLRGPRRVRARRREGARASIRAPRSSVWLVLLSSRRCSNLCSSRADSMRSSGRFAVSAASGSVVRCASLARVATLVAHRARSRLRRRLARRRSRRRRPRNRGHHHAAHHGLVSSSRSRGSTRTSRRKCASGAISRTANAGRSGTRSHIGGARGQLLADEARRSSCCSRRSSAILLLVGAARAQRRHTHAVGHPKGFAGGHRGDGAVHPQRSHPA